jgi:uncharacterized protein (UPF0332 family)
VSEKLWLKANDALRSAKLLLDAGDPDGAASRAYYAAFDAVRCALRERAGLAHDGSRKHSTMIEQFSRHFVLTGIVSRDLGRRLNRAFELRAMADYSDDPISEIHAKEAIDTAERIIVAIAPHLPHPPLPGTGLQP